MLVDVVDAPLGHADVESHEPAEAADVRAVGRQFDGELPAALMELWRRSDGLEMGTVGASVLGPAEVVRTLAEYDDAFDLAGRGLLPVVDGMDGDLIAAFVEGPLAPRVVFVPHDDAGAARLIYRDVAGLFRSLVVLLEMGVEAGSFYHDAEGDYAADGARSPADRAAARVLLASDGEAGEWNLAAQLLDPADVDDFARLLETDHFVRRDAVARMRQMSSPAIEELLRRDGEAFDAFAAEVIAALGRAGLGVGRRKAESVEVGGRWWNLEMFFFRRRIPDATRRLVEWIGDQVAGRDPRGRRGNFMED
jgi:hypothetical protein